MKRPSFQFYPGDWLRSTKLRSCSVGARGLWIDMICLMHEGAPYGYLKVGAKVILPANLARMIGATLPEVEGWLSELEHAEVFSRDDAGCLFSRRMVRDEKLRESRAAGGILGGNPALLKVNLPANLQPTPASSSASSSAIPKSIAASRPSNSQKKKTGLPAGFAISERVKAWAVQKGYARLQDHFDAFVLSAEKHGYRYSSWDAALMEAIRKDWAGFGSAGKAPRITVLPDLPRRDGDIPDAAKAVIAKMRAHG
jgi:hypothetical protein